MGDSSAQEGLEGERLAFQLRQREARVFWSERCFWYCVDKKNDESPLPEGWTMSPETQCCTGQGGTRCVRAAQREGSEANPEVWELQERGEGRKRVRLGWCDGEAGGSLRRVEAQNWA